MRLLGMSHLMHFLPLTLVLIKYKNEIMCYHNKALTFFVCLQIMHWTANK